MPTPTRKKKEINLNAWQTENANVRCNEEENTLCGIQMPLKT